ncbi:MAG TPA: hypothetical protein VMU16_15940 [Candidatus Binataceae bacterium]|nr:hypothetical protein [Candidatus Binataceae bacterium]
MLALGYRAMINLRFLGDALIVLGVMAVTVFLGKWMIFIAGGNPGGIYKILPAVLGSGLITAGILIRRALRDDGR